MYENTIRTELSGWNYPTSTYLIQQLYSLDQKSLYLWTTRKTLVYAAVYNMQPMHLLGHPNTFLFVVHTEIIVTPKYPSKIVLSLEQKHALHAFSSSLACSCDTQLCQRLPSRDYVEIRYNYMFFLPALIQKVIFLDNEKKSWSIITSLFWFELPTLLSIENHQACPLLLVVCFFFNFRRHIDRSPRMLITVDCIL